ncbi:MAG TPA: NUDIX hydrolase [Gammaproteobacteria bacterium]|nr:NUDIX hydrolase [Gammaproteobacteria bacterium]
MNFCSSCGEKVSLMIPEGDNRQRYVCQSCQTIHYENPKIVTGCIAQWQDRILLCKRAIEPRYGLWTLPAGFMENEETNLEGAARETREEANAEVENMQLFCVFSIAHINQVYTMYLGDLVGGEASPGEESLDVVLLKEEEIPWDNIAFHVITETLKRYYQDQKRGEFKTHYGDIFRQEDGSYIVNYF